MQFSLLSALLLVGSTTAFVPVASPFHAPSSYSPVVAASRTFANGNSVTILNAAAETGEDATQAWSTKDADTIFSVIDEDGNGSISLSELKGHMGKAGYADESIEKIFNALDKNKDGMISKGEFREGLVKLGQLRAAPGLGTYNSEFVKEITEDADFLFDAIDTDGGGTISLAELKVHLQLKTNKYSEKAISNIFRVLDVNDDSEISKDELGQAFIRSAAIRQALGEGPNYK